MVVERFLRPGSGSTWKRVFRGAGRGEVDSWGEFWTPCPIAALTFVEPDGRLLVGTLGIPADPGFSKLPDWDHETEHPFDGPPPPPQDGVNIQWCRDKAMRRILWHFGENRRVPDPTEVRNVDDRRPEVRNVAGGRFAAYRLVSEKARERLRLHTSIEYSDALVARVLRANGILP